MLRAGLIMQLVYAFTIGNEKQFLLSLFLCAQKK